MKQVLTWMLLFCIMTMSAGCATVSGPKFSVIKTELPAIEQDKSRIFFLREKHFTASMIFAPIKIDGSLVGECANGSFFFVDVEPGKHDITTERRDVPGKFTIELTTEPWRTYYVQVAPRDATAGALAVAFFGI